MSVKDSTIPVTPSVKESLLTLRHLSPNAALAPASGFKPTQTEVNTAGSGQAPCALRIPETGSLVLREAQVNLAEEMKV